MSASSSAQAEAAVQELRRAYAAGMAKAGLADGPGFFGWSSSQAAIAKNMADLSPRIDDWAGRRRRWAAAGKRDDGSSYSWQRWFPEGTELATAIAAQTGFAADASAFRVVADTVAATAADVAAGVGKVADVAAGVAGNLHVIALGAGAVAVAFVVWKLAR